MIAYADFDWLDAYDDTDTVDDRLFVLLAVIAGARARSGGDRRVELAEAARLLERVVAEVAGG